MRATIFQWARRVRASYWFVPSVMAAAAAALSLGAVQIDHWLLAKGLRFLPEYLASFDAESARAFLTTVVGSMITVAGVTFSITMVALSLASSQFGPRLLGNFMRDRGNQMVLGTFLATFLYNLLLLRLLRGFAGFDAVPETALAIALLLTVGSLGVLIYFFHHAAVSIQVGTVIAGVSDSLDVAVETIVGRDGRQGESAAGADVPAALVERFNGEGVVVPSSGRGYVEEVDEGRLLDAAVEGDLVIRVACRPGHFVVDRKPLAQIVPRVRGGRIDESEIRRAREAFLLGDRRTTGQDLEFALEQLVELAVRALSPGINDPFTAIHCIDVLGDALARLAAHPSPRPWRTDEGGEPRVYLPAPDFDGLLDSAYHQIRQNGRGTASVILRLLERLADVAERAATDAARAAVRRHADMLRRSGESLPEPDDRADLEGRYLAVLAALDGSAGGR